MKSAVFIGWLVLVFQVATAAEKIPVPALLTRPEAEAVIKEQMHLAATREKERLQSINAAPALSTVHIGTHPEASSPTTVSPVVSASSKKTRPLQSPPISVLSGTTSK